MTIRSSKAGVSAPGDVRIRRALLSVSDKRGLIDFARGLANLGVEIGRASCRERVCSGV